MTFQQLSRKSCAVALPKPEEHPLMRTILVKADYSAFSAFLKVTAPSLEEAL
jgi:hypothetical protein